MCEVYDQIWYLLPLYQGCPNTKQHHAGTGLSKHKHKQHRDALKVPYVHACVTLQDVPRQELGCHGWAVFAQRAVPRGLPLLGLLANSHLLLAEQLQICRVKQRMCIDTVKAMPCVCDVEDVLVW